MTSSRFQTITQRFRLCFAAFFLVVTIACSAPQSLEVREAQFFRGDSALSPRLTVEIADDKSEQRTGLMYRRELAPTAGMLFIFPDEDIRSFWMKNTYVSLDMIFLDAEEKIVSIQKNTRPLTTKSYASEGPAKYVLEVPAGSSDQWGLVPGAAMKLF